MSFQDDKFEILQEHLDNSRYEILVRLANFLGIPIPDLKDEQAQRIVLSKKILEKCVSES